MKFKARPFALLIGIVLSLSVPALAEDKVAFTGSLSLESARIENGEIVVNVSLVPRGEGIVFVKLPQTGYLTTSVTASRTIGDETEELLFGSNHVDFIAPSLPEYKVVHRARPEEKLLTVHSFFRAPVMLGGAKQLEELAGATIVVQLKVEYLDLAKGGVTTGADLADCSREAELTLTIDPAGVKKLQDTLAAKKQSAANASPR